MKLITLWVPEAHLEAVDKLVPKYYPSRAEALRNAIRDMINTEATKSAR